MQILIGWVCRSTHRMYVNFLSLCRTYVAQRASYSSALVHHITAKTKDKRESLVTEDFGSLEIEMLSLSCVSY
jgi:hypothetical protein